MFVGREVGWFALRARGEERVHVERRIMEVPPEGLGILDKHPELSAPQEPIMNCAGAGHWRRVSPNSTAASWPS